MPKWDLDYKRVYESKAGGYIDLHPAHGADELQENLEACNVLADKGYKIELLPSLPANELVLRQMYLADVFENKNPDIRIDGELVADIKTPDKDTFVKKSTINRAIYSAAKQKVEVAIINLSNHVYTVQDIKKGVVGALQPDRNKTIKQVWIITNSKNIFQIDRSFIFDDSIYERLGYL